MNRPDENDNESPQNSSIKRRTTRTILDYWSSFDPEKHRLGKLRNRRAYQNSVGPMARLWRAMRNKERVRVITRGLREPRAILMGNLIAFDRYWNLILSDVTECFMQVDPSALAGHSRLGRSKRRRQQRFISFFKRYENHLSPDGSIDFQTVRQEWKAYRRRKRGPMENGELSPDLNCVDREKPSTSAFEDPCKPTTAKPKLMCVTPTHANSLLSATAQPVPLVKQSQLLESDQWRTELIHHGQLFIRGANVIHVSFPDPTVHRPTHSVTTNPFTN